MTLKPLQWPIYRDPNPFLWGIIMTPDNKNGYKYKKYNEAIEFIKKNGIELFLEKTKNWTMQYGKY